MRRQSYGIPNSFVADDQGLWAFRVKHSSPTNHHSWHWKFFTLISGTTWTVQTTPSPDGTLMDLKCIKAWDERPEFFSWSHPHNSYTNNLQSKTALYTINLNFLEEYF